MDARRCKVFAFWSLVSFVGLFAAWFAIDALVNLDEFFEAADLGRPWFREAVIHYRGLVGSQGARLFGAVTLASVAFGGMASRRIVGPRTRAAG
jgi:hypothetical protein